VGYYRRQANAVYELQMREAIIRLTHAGKTDEEIARLLGQSTATIKKYRRRSMERAITHYVQHPDDDPTRRDPEQPDENDATDPRRRRVPPRGAGPGPHRPGSAKSPTEILPSPDTLALRRQCLDLRKAAMPFDEMAEHLGISEQEARQYTFEALKHLQDSELSTAELERRLMVEQLDQMIAAVHAPATGRHPTLGSVPPVLEAIDRMLRLMKQKADLLGLNQPPAVDILSRLRDMAEESKYDLLELQDIARDVLAKHRLHLPAYHEQSAPDLDPAAESPSYAR
jgi:DNA-binding CsgD family transcriptional regulator